MTVRRASDPELPYGSHALIEGWIYCPACGRQVKKTAAGMIPGHFRRGESRYTTTERCEAGGRTAP